VGDFFKNLLGFIDNKNTRQAVSALIISTALIAGAIAIVSVSYDNGWHLKIPEQFGLAFVVAYVILFIASWFILYLLNLKDGTDVYSEVRDNLSGTWVVTYDADIGPLSQEIVVPTRAVGCEIAVNMEKKLQLSFRVADNPIFEDDEKELIKDVAIRYNDSNGYTMFYYYNIDRTIKRSIADFILPEDGQNRLETVEIEIFARVEFTKAPTGSKITRMTGHWFDLNGNTSRDRPPRGGPLGMLV